MSASVRSMVVGRIPRFALEPIATEALIEAAPASIAPSTLKATVLPLFAAGEESASAMLVRVEDRAGSLLHEWPYAMQTWCIASCANHKGREWEGARDEALESPGSEREHRFSLPPTTKQSLVPLLTGALLYGTPGLCPTVFTAGAWNRLSILFRQHLPNEALAVLLGSLCQDPASGKMFTLVEGIARVRGSSGPDQVCGSALTVVDSLSQESRGLMIGIAHSHPQDKPCSRIVISKTDFETFRLRLRAAHMISLIVNSAPCGEPSAVALSWVRGGAVPAGFYVASGI